MDDHSNRMELVLKEEPYDGRSPEWWQEKFRFYRGLKQTYEKHLKRRKEEFHTIQQLSLLEEAVGDAARLQRILADIQVYEGYMRIVTQKIDDLDRRASDAALPRNFRE